MSEKWYNLTHQGAFHSITTEFQWKIREFSHNPNAYEVEQTTNCGVIISSLWTRRTSKDMKKIYSWSLLPAPILVLIVLRTQKKSLWRYQTAFWCWGCALWFCCLFMLCPRKLIKSLRTTHLVYFCFKLLSKCWKKKIESLKMENESSKFSQKFFFFNKTTLCNRLWRMHFRNHSINKRVNW